MTDRCERCGALISLVGHTHRCNPQRTAIPTVLAPPRVVTVAAPSSVVALSSRVDALEATVAAQAVTLASLSVTLARLAVTPRDATVTERDAPVTQAERARRYRMRRKGAPANE